MKKAANYKLKMCKVIIKKDANKKWKGRGDRVLPSLGSGSSLQASRQPGWDCLVFYFNFILVLKQVIVIVKLPANQVEIAIIKKSRFFKQVIFIVKPPTNQVEIVTIIITFIAIIAINNQQGHHCQVIMIIVIIIWKKESCASSSLEFTVWSFNANDNHDFLGKILLLDSRQKSTAFDWN